MGLIAKILSYYTENIRGVSVPKVKADPGGGANITMEHYSPCGEDTPPMNTDYAIGVKNAQTGGYTASGYIDRVNDRKSSPGEKRIYARDENGKEISEIYMKKNGDIEISNSSLNFQLRINGSIMGGNQNGFFHLLDNGDFNVNGFIIKSDGTVQAASGKSIHADTILANGKELSDHTHPAGTPPGTTGVNQ